jgi:hypothetical protein
LAFGAVLKAAADHFAGSYFNQRTLESCSIEGLVSFSLIGF